MKKNFSLWIIGPSAAGKSTISKIIYEKIKKRVPNLIIVDGDKVRDLYENKIGYDKISRSKNTLRYINLAKWLLSYDISSVCAVISPFEKDREICRKKIDNYFEVYLESSREERVKRDQKKLYLPALKGEKKFVIDVDIPFEKPLKSDLIINTEGKKPEEIADTILRELKI